MLPIFPVCQRMTFFMIPVSIFHVVDLFCLNSYFLIFFFSLYFHGPLTEIVSKAFSSQRNLLFALKETTSGMQVVFIGAFNGFKWQFDDLRRGTNGLG